MIEKHTEDLAADYVLDLLTAEDRQEFETRLHSDAELATFVRELSNALHAPLKRRMAAPRPDLFAVISQRIGSDERIKGETISVSDNSLRAKGTPFWTAFWAIAAAILLFLNLSLLLLLNRESSSISGAVRMEASAEEPGDTGKDLSAAGTVLQGEGYRAEISRLQDLLAERENELGEALASRQDLADEVEEARSINAGWQHEYARLAARVLPFFEPNDGMSRFTVIEMVDAEAYAREEPRLGFNELASLYLTGEGNIGGAGPTAFVGPVADGLNEEPEVVQLGQAGLTPVARSDLANPAAGPVDSSGSSAMPATGQTEAGSRPAGFTVWRDDEQKGFLDVYNLPEPAPGEQAYLWVRSGELDPYLPVGELPQLDNGTGSLFYSIDETNYTPSEILITSERPGEVGEAPSEQILLRGP